jgi:8-hydroxy-5-deazaflavin:NADPH oxidoreductase
VVFGVRDVADPRVQKVTKAAGSNVRAASVREAAAYGDVAFLAVPWPAIPDAIAAAGELTGKILVDCTNPLASDLSGLVLGTTTSAGEEVARVARGAKVVKAFNTIGAANFENPRFGSERASMFICGDDNDAPRKLWASSPRTWILCGGCRPIARGPLAGASGDALDSLGLQARLGPTGHGFKLLRR